MTPAQRLANLWLLVIAVWSAAAIGAAAGADGSGFTMLPLLWFLAACPGLPYALLLRLADPVQRWVLAIGLSVALDAVVAEVLLYAGWYTGLRTVVVLAVIACVGALIGRLSVRGDAEPADAPVVPVEMSGGESTSR
jgi:hypothetical protein